MSETGPRELSHIVADFQILVNELSARIVFLETITAEALVAYAGERISLKLNNRTAGSTLEIDNLPSGITLDDENSLLVGIPDVIGKLEVSIRERLLNAKNSPLDSLISFLIEPKPGVATPLRLGNSKIRLGNSKIRLGSRGITGGTNPTPQPLQNFSFGPVIGQAGEGSTTVQNFSFGPVVGTPGEGSVTVQNFSFGPAIGSAGEDTTVTQKFSFGPPIGSPGEDSVFVQKFSFGPAIGSPGEDTIIIQNFSFEPALGTAGEEAIAQQKFSFALTTIDASE